jgi:hypothetical protein
MESVENIHALPSCVIPNVDHVGTFNLYNFAKGSHYLSREYPVWSWRRDEADARRLSYFHHRARRRKNYDIVTKGVAQNYTKVNCIPLDATYIECEAMN